MSWLPAILTVIHVIVSVFLILVVLLQQGKSADWSGAFGGGSSQAAFGARSTATVLSKATTVAAILFMLTSLSLTILLSRPGGSSVIREDAIQQQTPAAPPVEAPVQPAPVAPTTAPKQ